jgi:hypothetical protein
MSSLYSTGFVQAPYSPFQPLGNTLQAPPLYNTGYSQPPIVLQAVNTLPVMSAPAPGMYSTVANAPAAVPPPTPTSKSPIDDVPQPKPPAGWVLVGSCSLVDQNFDSIQYTYEYTFAPPGPDSAQSLPTRIPPPKVPKGWKAQKSTLSIDKDEKKHTYKYLLSYQEPSHDSDSD